MDGLVASLARAAFLVPSCAVFGAITQHLRLPRITGYLVAGILIGPQALGIVQQPDVDQLWIIDQACLGLIVLAAGAELQWEQLAKIKSQVIWILLGISSATWLMVFAAMMLLAPMLSTVQGFNLAQVAAFSSLCATLMIARSPASAIAVLQETQGKGPFCSLAMAVVVAKDVFVIVVFALNIEMTKPLFSADVVDWGKMLEPLVNVLFSCMLGVGGSVLVTALLRGLQPFKGQAWAAGARMAGLMLVATAVFEMAVYIEAEPLLACATSGLLATNRTTEREREELHHALSDIMTYVNLPFFSLAGAGLQVGALAEAMWLGIIIFGVRIAAIFSGSWAGCWLSSTPPEIGRRMWQAMVTQAGVSLGLARMVSRAFPEWGRHFQTLMVSIIILNLMAGPPLFRNAIVAAGESRLYSRDHKTEDETNSPPLEARLSNAIV